MARGYPTGGSRRQWRRWPPAGASVESAHARPAHRPARHPRPRAGRPPVGGTLVAEARGLRFFNTRLDLYHLFPTVSGPTGRGRA
ncbi:MAG: hypothetical protein R3F43_19385 [bacterium]